MEGLGLISRKSCRFQFGSMVMNGEEFGVLDCVLYRVDTCS